LQRSLRWSRSLVLEVAVAADLVAIVDDEQYEKREQEREPDSATIESFRMVGDQELCWILEY
jgi:hypothetical protein